MKDFKRSLDTPDSPSMSPKQRQEVEMARLAALEHAQAAASGSAAALLLASKASPIQSAAKRNSPQLPAQSASFASSMSGAGRGAANRAKRVGKSRDRSGSL